MPLPHDEQQRAVPLGVMPRWRWLELRQAELLSAVCRYTSPDVAHGLHTEKLVAGWLSEASQNAEEIVLLRLERTD